MIELKKFERLEKKYSKLCLKQLKITNILKKFEKMPQAVINHKDKEGLYIRRFKSGLAKAGIIYLKNTRVRKNHCDICLKRRKTKAHHIIPKRCGSVNKELSQVRIRVCNECEKKIHPENRYEESFILGKKEKQIIFLQEKLKRKISKFIELFGEKLKNREKSLIFMAKKIPEQLKNNKKKICPAMMKVSGRVQEMRYIRGLFNKELNGYFLIIEDEK